MSRFVIRSDGSEIRAVARSSVHPFSYRAPLTGEIKAEVVDGRFDLEAPIFGVLDLDLHQLRGDDPHTDGEMHRRLDSGRYPKATARVNEVTPNGGDAYHLGGELTLRGKTRPMSGQATVSLDDEQLHARGTLTIDVREFGIKPPSLVLLRVHPEVEVTIDLVATRDES